MSLNYKEYAEFFEVEMKKNLPIYNSHGELLEIQEGEKFKQVYDPGSKILNVFPKYWFLSNMTGNLISAYGGKLRWIIKVNENKSPYPYYFFNGADSKKKSIAVHHLVALVWSSDIFGKAKDYLEKKSLDAFGRTHEDGKINVHHKYSVSRYPEKRFDQNNLEIVTGKSHSVVNEMPKIDTTPEKRIRFVNELNGVAYDEAPDKVVVLTDGEKKELFEVEPNSESIKKIINNVVSVLDFYLTFNYDDGSSITIKPECRTKILK